jgi:aryl-alcohol dehydrogenase-like predicted oxidoreductase
MSNSLITREIGSSGIEATAVGLGTWAMGGWMWGGTDEALSVKAIHASIDEGISLIDTAPAYGMGKSEELVGQAIQGRRDKVILSTKCGLVWHTQQGNHFFDQADKPVHRYLGKDSIIHEVEESLKRLGTDYIDHYITHWQDPTTPVAETLDTLNTLKQQGKIRSIGISNVSADDLNAYQAAGGIDAIQECYSMLDRGVEQELVPLCQQNNVSILSYSSLALGLLSGKIGPDRQFNGDDLRIDNPRFSQANRTKISSLFDDIRSIADDHSATIAQLVIAWTIQQPGITFALCGARNPQQAIENAKAAAIALSVDEVTLISSAAGKYLNDMDE